MKERENLKEGMGYIKEENKELNDKYQQVSATYENLVLKEPNQGEHQLLKNLLRTVHEKCTRAEEAYKQAMDLYLQDTQAPVTMPSLGSNDLEQLKEEIRSLKEKNKDLSEKLTL